jgi:beta-glucosidase
MKKTLFISFLLILLLPACIPSGEPKQESKSIQYPFQDPSLPIKERAKDLVSRLTLEEKVQQMMYNAPAIERLGIPAYPWWSECLHGVARAGKATVFPQAIGMAASFDPDLISRIASAIGDEGRAFFHAADKRGNRLQYGGLLSGHPTSISFVIHAGEGDRKHTERIPG